MAPVVYKDVSKKAKDLLEKDFVSGQSFEVKNKTSNGLEFKTEGKRKGNQAFDIDFEVEYTDKPAGLKVKERLTGTNEMKLDVELANKIVDGLKINVESVTAQGFPQDVKATVEFKNAHSATVVVADLHKSSVDVSTVLGFDRFQLGAKTSVTAKGDLSRPEFIASFTTPETVITAGLKDDNVSATFVHNVAAVEGATVVGSAVFNTAHLKPTSLAVGYVCKSGTDGVVKAKVDLSGDLSLLYSQKVNANLTLSLGTTIKTTKLGQKDSQDVGVCFKYSS